MKLLSTLFVIIGLILVSFGGYQLYLRENPHKLSFDNYAYAVDHKAEAKQLPAQVAIHDVNIDVPVYPATISNGQWPVIENGASYLSTSPLPGEKGNSVIYAHNWKNLFGNLVNTKPGEEVVITYKDGSKKTFVIEYTSTVSPNESTILAPSKDKRITLYTCTGFLDSKRFVVVALLKN